MGVIFSYPTTALTQEKYLLGNYNRTCLSWVSIRSPTLWDRFDDEAALCKMTMHNHLQPHNQTMINGVTHPPTSTENGRNPLPPHRKQTSPTTIITQPNNDRVSNYTTKKVMQSTNDAQQQQSVVNQQFLPLQQLRIITQLEEWMELLRVGRSKSDMKWQMGAMWQYLFTLPFEPAKM